MSTVESTSRAHAPPIAHLAPEAGGRPFPAVKTRICVVVPALNEEETITTVVRRIKNALPDSCVIVVDDGSADRTAARAKAAGAVVMTLSINLGIGGAVQAGIRYAHLHEFHVAVQVDGDGQHDPTELARLLAPILSGRADMTVGSRWLGRGEYHATPSRRLGMRILASLVRLRAHRVFTDTTSGFRAVGPAGISLFSKHYPNDFPEVESLVLASRSGLRIEEVPVRMIQRSHGRSSIAGLRSAYYMARVMISLLVGSLNRGNISLEEGLQ